MQVCKSAFFFDGQIVFFSHFFPTRLVLKEMHLKLSTRWKNFIFIRRFSFHSCISQKEATTFNTGDKP